MVEDNISVVTYHDHTPKSYNPRVSIITYEPSATMSDKVRFFDAYCKYISCPYYRIPTQYLNVMKILGPKIWTKWMKMTYQWLNILLHLMIRVTGL